jgi:hypothetical protein
VKEREEKEVMKGGRKEGVKRERYLNLTETDERILLCGFRILFCVCGFFFCKEKYFHIIMDSENNNHWNNKNHYNFKTCHHNSIIQKGIFEHVSMSAVWQQRIPLQCKWIYTASVAP